MQRLQNGSQAAAPPAYAGQGAPGYPQLSAVWDPYTAHMIIEELLAVVTAAGITPSSTTLNQVLTALQTLIAAGTSAFLTDTGLANAYVVTPAPALGAYSAGYTAVFKAAHANTGASTLNVSGLGAKAIVHRDGTALQAGDIPASSACRVVYDGAQFQLEDSIPTLATTALEGLVQLATNTQAAAMAATNVALTPSNLAGVFSQNLGNPGYIGLPGGAQLHFGLTGAISQNSGAVAQAYYTSLPIGTVLGAGATLLNASGGVGTDYDQVAQIAGTPGRSSLSVLIQAIAGASTSATYQIFWWVIGK